MPGRDETEELNRETERLRQEREQRDRDQAERDAAAELGQLRETNEGHLGTVRDSAQNLAALREERGYVLATIANWDERNHRYKNLDALAMAGHVMMSISPAGVVVTDTLLLSVAGRELLRAAAPFLEAVFGKAELVMPIAILLFAIGYLTIELCTGHELDPPTGRRRRAIGPLAIVMCVSLPLLVAAFSALNAGILTSNPTRPVGTGTFTAAIIRAVGLGAVALVVHGFILFFGARIVEGIGFDLYKLRQIQLRRRLVGIERRITVETRNVEGGFRNFYNGFYNGNGDGGQSGAGPFGSNTRRVVNDVFDDSVIEEPPPRHGRPAAGPGGAQPAEPDPPNPADGPARHGRRNGTQPGPNADTDVPPRPIYDTDGEDEIRR